MSKETLTNTIMKKRIRIEDVAREAGVSITTVSRTLNGSGYVKESTRRKVLAALEVLDYRPGVVRSTIEPETEEEKIICMVIPSIENLIFPQIIKGAEDYLRKHACILSLCNTEEDPMIERESVRRMLNQGAAGFLVCSAERVDRHLRILHEKQVPAVLLNRSTEEEIYSTVSVDHFQAAYDAVQYLIQSGRKKIAIASGREELLLYEDRLKGYCRALTDAGLPVREEWIMRDVSGRNGFYQKTIDLLDGPERPDAIFCTSDPKAFVVMRALQDQGVRIPEEIAVMGFDNVAISALVEPTLTTVAQPFQMIGETAARLLLKQIQYMEEHGALPKAFSTVMPTELIVRKST